MPESRVPPVSTLRARRRVETMALIEAAAADLFEAQGYEQTTVEQIADRAGISMRTFYRHCASKDGTLVGELADGPATFIRHLAAHLPGPLLAAVVDGFVESIAVEPEMRRRLTRIIVQTPALRASWLAAGRQAQDDLVELFQRERPDLGALAVRGLAAATIAALTVAVESWAIGESPSAREAAAEALSTIAPALARPMP